VRDSFRRRDAVPLEQALSALRRFDLLLVSTHPCRDDIVPAKLWEYLAAGRPVLSLSKNPEVERILERTGTGVQFDPEAPDTVAGLLAESLSNKRAGQPLQLPFDPRPEAIQAFSARNHRAIGRSLFVGRRAFVRFRVYLPIRRMSDDQTLRERAATGLNWRFVTQGVQMILQGGVGVLLARLLPPEDFGLVGLALIVINFGRMVSDLGLADAIVQHDELTRRHLRVGFTSSVALGLLLTGGLYLLAPSVAVFLRDARITPLLRFISVSFFLTGFSIVAEALLRRRMDFKRLMIVEVVSYGLGYGLVAITLALSGYGPWSLAWGTLAQSFVNAVVSYGLVRHPVRPLAALSELGELADFGVGVSLGSIANHLARKGDFFVIGRLLGAGPLGLYTRAYRTMKFPLSYSGRVLSKVLFPALSRIREDTARVKAAYEKTISMLSLVVLPVMVMMIVLAPELIVGLFGEQWRGTVLPLQILAAFGLFRTGYHVLAMFIKASGYVYRLFVFQLVYAVAVVGGTWAAATTGGLPAATAAVGGAILLMYVLVVAQANRLTGTSLSRFLKLHVPSLLASVPVLAFSLGCRQGLRTLDTPDLLIVAGGVLTALAGTFGALHVLPRLLVRPVVRLLYQMLDQGLIPERADAFLRAILPRLQPSAPA
jgi:PST family polysaccharide transporter